MMTGYDMHSILGHNCRFLQGPETDKAEIRKLKVAIAEGKEEQVMMMIQYQLSDGWINFTLNLAWMKDGLLILFSILILDLI